MRYEYKIAVLAYGQDLVENYLNLMGLDRWKLVTVDFDARRYIFERAITHDNTTKPDNTSSV